MLTATRAIVTDTDHLRLTQFLESLGSFNAHNHGYAGELVQRLNDAEIVPAAERRDRRRHHEQQAAASRHLGGTPDTMTLVYESKTGGLDGTVSIRTPLGLALLGARQGDEVDWNFNLGVARLRIEEVLFQPEANKRFEL